MTNNELLILLYSIRLSLKDTNAKDTMEMIDKVIERIENS